MRAFRTVPISAMARLGLASMVARAGVSGHDSAVAQAVPSQPGPAPVPVPDVELPFVLANSPIGANVVDSITVTENQSLQQAAIGRLSQAQATDLLGKLLINDRNLSPNRLEACSSCHTPQAGFTGGVSFENLSDVAYPGGAEFFKAYTHNGTFKTLKNYVHFYNTRDALPPCGPDSQNGASSPVGVTCWPAPEAPQTVNHALTGNLGLSDGEENAIVAFLGTLSDGYNPNTGQQQ